MEKRVVRRPKRSYRDASPTKARTIHHRAKVEVRSLFALGFGTRPQEELYDFGVDSHYLINVAGEAEYEDLRADLAERLM